MAASHSRTRKDGRWVSYLMVAGTETFPSTRFPFEPSKLKGREVMQFEMRGWSRPVDWVIADDTLASSFGRTLDSYVRACEQQPFVDKGGKILVCMLHNGKNEDGSTPGVQRIRIPTYAIARTDINLSAGMITIRNVSSLAYRLVLLDLPPWDETPWNDSENPAPKLLHMSDMIFLNWEKANVARSWNSGEVGDAAEEKYHQSMKQLNWVFMHPENLSTVLTSEFLETLWKVRPGTPKNSGEFPPGRVISFDFQQPPFLEILMGMPIIQAVAFTLMQHRAYWGHRIISRIYIARDEELYDSKPMILLKIEEANERTLHWMRSGLEAGRLAP